MNGRDRSRVLWSVIYVLALTLVLVLAPPGLAPARADEGAEDVIILFREEVRHADKEKAVRDAGATLKHNYLTVKAAAAHVPSAAARKLLESDPRVLAVIPDRPVEAHASGKGKHGGGTPPPPSNTQVVPAGVQRVGAAPGALVWTGVGVGVAVVDTGIDFAHLDLQPLGASCFTVFTACQDDNGHGTHVSGIIAARNNLIDVVGVAPKATLYAVKVLNGSGSGTDSTVMAGLDWVTVNASLVDPPIRVVNMSLGRQGTLDDNPALHQSVKNLHALGIAVVVSAGNDSSLQVSQEVPATYPEVMAIASTTALTGSNAGCSFFTQTIKADTASYFTTDGAYDTSTGIGVTISAPGEDQENVTSSCFATSVGILSTRLGGGTTRLSGTSMSAPHVSGVAALMWEKALSTRGTLDPETGRGLIRSRASGVSAAPLDSPTGGYSFGGEREGVVSAGGATQ